MFRRLSCLCLALLLQPAGAAPPEWGGSLVLSSDNLMRGTSRSSSDAALAGEVHAQSGGWVAALWASTSHVRPSDPTTVDVALTLGYGMLLDDDWSLRGSVVHYESPWQNRSAFYRYNELTLDLRFRESLLLSVSYSPDTSRFGAAYGPVSKRRALAYEASWQLPLREGIHGNVGVGYYDLSALFGHGYWYGSAGLAWSRGHWRAQAAYVITEARADEVSYVGDGGRRGLFSLGYFF